jgi:hypothetical protein
MRHPKYPVAAAAAVLISLAAAAPGGGLQDARQAHRLLATRAELEALLPRLDSLAASSTADRKEGEQAGSEAQLARTRLLGGDFQSGDRVMLWVEGEKELSDTFVVAPGHELLLPTVGVVPLQGVLRSEIEPQLTRYVSRVIRDPLVRARALIRVSVSGDVVKPGYYGVPPDAVLSDVLTAAGGLTKDAKLHKMRVERGGNRVLQGDALRQLIEQGQTLDAAGVEPGDQFIVPGGRGGDALDTVRLIATVLGIPITIYTLTKIF